MKRQLLEQLAARAVDVADLAALTVLGLVWVLTGAWRAIPRHNEEACWECQLGVTHDRTAVVL